MLNISVSDCIACGSQVVAHIPETVICKSVEACVRGLGKVFNELDNCHSPQMIYYSKTVRRRASRQWNLSGRYADS